MHEYRWDVERLERKLKEFVGGQFRLKTRQGTVFQGKFTHWNIPDRKRHYIIIYFEWLCEMTSLGSDPDRLVKWRELEVRDNVRLFGIEWLVYYVQKRRDELSGRKPREERLKIKHTIFTKYREECWFYREGDPEYLYKGEDGEFAPQRTLFMRR